MGIIKLQPRCPERSVIVSSVDPDPNWTLDDLLSELDSLEAQLGFQTHSHLKQPQTESRVSKVDETDSGCQKPFVMSISDTDDEDEDDYEHDTESESEGSDDRSLIAGSRFSFNDIGLSDSEESDSELHINTIQCTLIQKNSLEECILFDHEREQQLKVKEQVRNALSELEPYHQKKFESSQHAMLQLEKYIEERRDIDRMLDNQYQRKSAEVLHSHLSAVQRNLEQRSQVEERRIRDDAAIEEAKRKEKALHEEKLQREKARVEAEAREKAAKLAEEQRLANEAAKRVAEEAARKEYDRAAAQKAADATVNAAREKQKVSPSEEPCSIVPETKLCGINVIAADAALKAEENRLRIYSDVAKGIPNIPHKDFAKYGRKMFKIAIQISGTFGSVRSQAHEFISTINDSFFPHPISILIFAQKVVSLCNTPREADDQFIFACAYVILLVSSQVPSVVDFVLAELHKACMYTVPKLLRPSNPAAPDKDYWKMIGFLEEDNKMESSDSYLKRMRAYMKLYGALVQTEIQGTRNPHGLERGWAWLAMFLNSIPPSKNAAFALDAFLRMAGFQLYKRYKSQFLKIMNVIARSYLPALKRRDDLKWGEIVQRLEQYIVDKAYQREPKGWRLEEGELLSNEFV